MQCIKTTTSSQKEEAQISMEPGAAEKQKSNDTPFFGNDPRDSEQGRHIPFFAFSFACVISDISVRKLPGILFIYR